MAKSYRKRNSGWGPWPWLLGLTVVAIVALLIARSQGGKGPGETFPAEGRAHVEQTQRVTYHTDPPTSGNHWGAAVPAGFYTEAPAPELLVHNLEHGNIIFYYDVGRLPKADMDRIRQMAQQYRGDFDGVVAVPRQDAEFPLILTAWQHRLRLPGWNEEQVMAFVDAYRGRGPEQRVR